MSPRRGIPFVVSAPSGTGKTTLCRAVVARDPQIVFSVSHTTRAPRSGERDGVDYHFVSETEFHRLADTGAFVEFADYRENLYGTSWGAIETPLAAGSDVLLEIEIQGARQVRERLPQARLIFLLPPSLAELERRLRARGTEAPDVIERRLAIAHEELRAVSGYDYAVVNHELERAIADVLEIVAGERAGRVDELRRRHGRDAVVRAVAGTLPLSGAG